jgi:tetratricopeptide (TPR) repeat protein
MRRHRWTAGALILAGALAPRPLAAGWEEGRAAYDAGRFEEAVAEFRAGAERSPDSPEWHYMLGRALDGAGRPREAVPALERAVALAPERSEYRLVLAHLQVRAGAADAALATLADLPIEAVPAQARSNYALVLASAASRAADPAAPRPQLERAAGVMADSPELWRALGQARRAAGDPAGAYDAFARGFELAPADENLARQTVVAGLDLARAADPGEERVRRFARVAPVADRLPALVDTVEAKLTAGEAWLGAEETARARAWYQAAAAADPADPRPHLFLGQCALAEGETRAALAHFDAALERATSADLRREAQAQRGYALQVLGEYDRAAVAYRAAGDEARARGAETAAAAAAQNQAFYAEQRECRERIRQLEEGRDDLVKLGARHEVEVVERRLARVRAECAPYLSEAEG